MSPETSTIEAPPTELSWMEAQKQFQSLAEGTKTVTFNVGTKEAPRAVKFTVKCLTQREKDKVDEAAVRPGQGRGEATVNLGGAKNALIKHGVINGPPGWTGSDTDIGTLPADIRDELAEAVSEYTTLDEETRIGFL